VRHWRGDALPRCVRVSALLGHVPHCSPIADINTEQTGWAGARQWRLHLESRGGGGCGSSDDCSSSTTTATAGPDQATVGAKEGATAAAPTPAKGEGGMFPSPLCFQSLEIAATALRLALFSLLLSVFNLQRFATCCINGLLIAHCKDCFSLTVNINESVGSTAAHVHVDGYDPMADPKRRARSNDPG
jgi:hypothetical protein